MIPSWGASPVKPRPLQLFHAFYLHAGDDGRADVMKCLIQLVTEVNNDATFDFKIDLRVHDVDLLLGGSALDLQSPGRKASILGSLADAHFVFHHASIQNAGAGAPLQPGWPKAAARQDLAAGPAQVAASRSGFGGR